MECGYRQTPSNREDISVFYKAGADFTIVIPFINYDTSSSLTKEQYQHMIRQIADHYSKSGTGKIAMLTLIITERIDEAKQLLEVSSGWIIDKSTNRLIQYENQPDHFFELKPVLLSVLDREDSIPIPKPRRKKGIILANYSPINAIIIAINVLVFIFLEIIGSTEDIGFMVKYGALYAPLVAKYGQYYRLITCTFLHFGLAHLASNMLVLFFLGDNVERAVGKIKYLIIYLGSGLVGSICSFAYSYMVSGNIVSVGASGAIFGIIGALFYIVLKNRGRIEDMTAGRVGLLIIYSLYTGIQNSNIDNFAHIGGLFAGFLLSVILYRKKQIN